MQETPQFEQVKQRFNSYDKEQILGEASSQPIVGKDAELIAQIFQDYPLYFSDNAFRQKLTTQGRQTIESQITASCDQFDQITQTRSNGSLVGQLPNFINNLSSYYEEFKNRYLNSRRIDTLENGGDTNRIVQEINQILEDSQEKEKQLENIVQISKELATKKGATLLANFFHRLYDGEDINEDDLKAVPVNNPRTLDVRDVVLILALTFIVSLIIPGLWAAIGGIDAAIMLKVQIWMFILAALSIGYGAYRYIVNINKKFTGGYKRASVIWAHGVVASLIFTAVYSFWAISSLKLDPNNLQIGEVLIKAIILLAPIYFIRFCVRNFNANKHLAATNLHRATSIRIFESFIQNINDGNKEVYSQMARLVFEIDETGFITRKEGAGSSDSSIEFPVGKR